MMKRRQDYEKIDSRGVDYAEIGTELSWPIRRDVVYHENQRGKQHDRSYRCDLCRIRY